VSKLYRASVTPSHMLLLTAAALSVVTVAILISPAARLFLSLLLLRLRTLVGL
jgi:hypothetical protein